MVRRISNSAQGHIHRSVAPSTRGGARTQTISGVQTEAAEPSRTQMGIAEAGAAGFRRQRYRENQINFYTIAEIAERLHVSARTVRRWAEAGDLVVHRVGGVVRIAESDLRGFLALHRQI